MRNEIRQSESEWKNQVSSLKNEVKDREHDIQILQRTVEKLRTQTGQFGEAKNGCQRPFTLQVELKVLILVDVHLVILFCYFGYTAYLT